MLRRSCHPAETTGATASPRAPASWPGGCTVTIALLDAPGVSSGPIRFDARYRGALPDHANGGIVAGALADRLTWSGAVEVRLVRPVPLDTTLQVVIDGTVGQLSHDDVVLASIAPAGAAGAATVARLAIVAPRIDLDDARRPEPVVDVHTHPAPGCFVCGPAHPDGLDLQPGMTRVPGAVATVWEPDVEFALAGHVAAPYVWAALDCPAWYGAAAGRPALLGTIVGRQLQPLPWGERVVVTGWLLHHEGRKTHAGSALHTATGELIAVAASTWIHPKEHPA